MQTIKVYFGGTPLIITSDTDRYPNGRHASSPKEALTMLRSSIVNENHEPVILKTDAVDVVKEEMFKEFKLIEAGGGLVFNNEGRYLIIYRRGHWDLPKGKWDDGESIEECALREVTEETGLDKLTIVQPLPASYHVYSQNGVEILKKTHWYLMRHEGDSQLRLQTDEDIEDGRWISSQEVDQYIDGMYPLIRDLIETAT